MDRLELLRDNLSRQLGWISAADAKVPPLFAIDTAMLAAATALLPGDSGWSLWLGSLAGASAFCLGASLLNLFWAHSPRTTGPADSLVYFGTVSKKDPELFAKELLSISEADYLMDLASQCHRNAEIAELKYRHVTLASRFFFAAIPFWLSIVYIAYGQ